MYVKCNVDAPVYLINVLVFIRVQIIKYHQLCISFLKYNKKNRVKIKKQK
jgi:hypothetical protein